MVDLPRHATDYSAVCMASINEGVDHITVCGFLHRTPSPALLLSKQPIVLMVFIHYGCANLKSKETVRVSIVQYADRDDARSVYPLSPWRIRELGHLAGIINRHAQRIMFYNASHVNSFE
jgi:hypothetical protein